MVLLLLASACADSDDAAETSATTAGSTTAEGSTTAPTPGESPSPTTTGAPGADPQPCTAGEAYTTSPDWELASLPDGFTLDESSTYVDHPDGTTYDSLDSYLLLQLDEGGRLLADLTVQRWADLDQFEPDPATSAGFAISERGADSVRGHEGQVVRVVNRGDSVGHAVARWMEDGAGWGASSTVLDVNSLASALEPLSLGGDVGDLGDTTGSFVLIGRSTPWQEEQRTTRIIMSGSGTPSSNQLVFNIEQSAPGDSGITSLHPNRHPSSATFSDLGGRTVVDYDGITLTTLPDGAVVSLEERSDGNPLGLDGAARLALIDGLQRVDPEQWWIAGQPGRDGLCREGADG